MDNSRVEIEDDPATTEAPPPSSWSELDIPIDWIVDKSQLRQMLLDVDQKLIDLYTNRNTVENKTEKRSLQRLKKKIIDKLNDGEPDE